MQNEKEFDVVIVGAGITGSIIAKELSKKCHGLEILILEAGMGNSSDFSDYELYNDQYYNAIAKTPNSPYSDSRFAPSPSVLDVSNIQEHGPITKGYFVQEGPYPFLSNYNRNIGGTTLHWLGTTLRMCPNDFKLKTVYGQGVDWPISYEDLQPYYRRAEFEIGVSAEVEEQAILGIHFQDDYVFPMHKIPQSYLDQQMSEGLKGLKIDFEGQEYPVKVISTPQGRNGMPNPQYRNEETRKITGFTPIGAVGAPELGQRCEGNSNCVPICPVQAKYNAIKTLDAALKNTNSKVIVLNQSPVSTIEIDPSTHKVTKVHYKTYEYTADKQRANIQSHVVQGKIVILAANAIENAKILLASKACTTSGQVGKNLMDHLVMLTWGLFPQDIGAYRGPGSTSGMPLTRDGNFRKNRSAFRVEIGNWGWNWPQNTPESTLKNAVDGNAEELTEGLFGDELIEYIKDQTSRQFRIGWEMEQLPSDKNYITINENYKDDLGNYRPIIHYELNDYEKKGAVAAAKFSDLVFNHLGITSKTSYKESDPGYFEYQYTDECNKETIFRGTFNGAGHVVGCHRMGTDQYNSVVDENQRSHEHPNLFVAGCGSFPTLATSNPTLTMAALAFKTADAIITEFQ
ncbi:choline dehydrogenase-like flavoprotein [Xenococcus sp. PCC 7305]|uniref:GMC family oxidoreductase n=1 Tax=Xenococcus sp. PCC 7305 TaxID=102125 RepID=UPI0002ABCB67|nr:GMC family oxidoreductase [Xenococcus sp. PCC 7305]ELS05023.1 choline dehydrogenase-like flavoprotein [Xenococcus sp. PCC 7305]